MNNDENPYAAFGKEFSVTSADFAESDSYRWVRNGIYLLIIAYALLFPLSIVLPMVTKELIPVDLAPTIMALVIGAMIVGLLLLVAGSLLLLSTPKQNEKKKIKWFFLCYGIVIVSFFVWKLGIGGNAPRLIQKIAQAYGVYFLIAYFEVLAINQGSEKLYKTVRSVNFSFILMLVMLFGASFIVGVFKLPQPVFLIALIAVGAFFVLSWMRTLWLAAAVTRHDHVYEELNTSKSPSLTSILNQRPVNTREGFG